MTAFLVVFLGLLVLVTIAMMVILYYLRKGIRFFRRFSSGDMTEDEFQRMANKYYYKEKRNSDGPQFDDNYFKGNPGDRKKQQQRQQSHTTRTTRTADGVTIVDNRQPSEVNKKIFAHDEGEYVDYVED
ncbi:MAG: DUF4834 family protein [Prevotella sp.]|nr:DUF4834 family protein [Prevotella sp.]